MKRSITAICTIILFAAGNLAARIIDIKGTNFRLDKLSRISGGVMIIDDNSERKGSDIYSSPVTVEPDTVYKLSAGIKYTGSKTGLIYIRCYNGRQQIGKSRLMLRANQKAGQWNVLSGEFTTGAKADNVKIWIHSSNGSTGKYYIKDIVLVKSQTVSRKNLLKNATTGHTRIFINPAKIAEIKSQIARDPAAKNAFNSITAFADQLITAEPIVYKKEGRRMLKPANETVIRIKYLGMAFLLTGKEAYAREGIKLMLAAAKLPNWNPSHFLDTAELSLAVGLGYDWFYHQMTESERNAVVNAIVQKGLLPSFNKKQWWVRAASNWNQICNGGLGIAAMAIWDKEPEIASKTLQRSISGLPYAMKCYAPDGVYPEGQSYWAYGTTWCIMFINALRGVIHDDCGLAKYPGFLDSVNSVNFHTGPIGRTFNYSDGYRHRYFQSAMYWFAAEKKDPSILFMENELMQRDIKRPRRDSNYPDMVMFLIWNKNNRKPVLPAKRNWVGKGIQPVALFRSSWDRNATFVGMKGGSPKTLHAHVDAGTFVIDADGVRWVSDLRSQNYNIEEKAKALANKQGKNFTPAFFKNYWSHNILLVDGQSPVVDSYSPILRCSDDPKNPYAVFDLSPAYKGQLAYARRGMRLNPDKTVLIQDEIKNLQNKTVHIRWSILTYNDISSIQGNTLRLTQNPKNTSIADLKSNMRNATMQLKILSPANAKFEVINLKGSKYINYYDHIDSILKQVIINIKLPPGAQQTLAVLFKPDSVPEKLPTPGLTSLKTWAR